MDVPKVSGPTVILQKSKPKVPVSVTESAESLSQVSVSDKTEKQSNDRTRNVTQSETKSGVEISKNYKETQESNQTSSKNSQDSIDSRDAISRVSESGGGDGVLKDNLSIPATPAQSAVSNGSEKESSTPKKERYIPPLPRSASK